MTTTGSFIFSHPKWLRALLKPEPGTTLYYCDYAQQEPALAAFLSGDPGLRRCYHTDCGSFYVALMIECGFAPKGATKKSHPEVHKAGKVLLLAISYGAGANLVSKQLNISHARATALLQRLQNAFPVFYRWRDEVLLRARWQGYMETPDGWRMAVDSRTNPRCIYNFPMQGSGATMMRCAGILTDKVGVPVLATVHDAQLCEANSSDKSAQTRISQSMDAAAELVAPDFKIRHDIEAYSYPNRYVPEDLSARVFWNKIMRLLAREEGCDPTPWLIQE